MNSQIAADVHVNDDTTRALRSPSMICRSRRLTLAAASVAVVLLTAACGLPGEASSTTASASKGVVSTGATPLGTVLVDGRGRTLYELTSNTPGRPACTGACLDAWPPVLLSAKPQAGAGVTATLATVAAAGGQQLSINGHLVYTFRRDLAPGQVAGQGIRSFGGTWWALDPTGTPITRAGSPSPKPTDSSGDVRGY